MVENRQNWTDEELMSAIARKDHDAFTILFGRYHGKVLGIIYRYVGNQGVAEDLIQEVFLKVYRFARRFQPKAKFSTWLFKLVVNHCINYYRYVKARPPDTFAESEVHEDRDYSPRLVLESKGPEAILFEKERISELRRAIDSLPERQKVAIILQRFEGLSYAEISEVMDCSVKAVESLLQRAMVTLKDALKTNW